MDLREGSGKIRDWHGVVSAEWVACQFFPVNELAKCLLCGDMRLWGKVGLQVKTGICDLLFELNDLFRLFTRRIRSVGRRLWLGGLVVAIVAPRWPGPGWPHVLIIILLYERFRLILRHEEVFIVIFIVSESGQKALDDVCIYFNDVFVLIVFLNLLVR